MAKGFLKCGTGVKSISWKLVNSSGTQLQSGTCTATEFTSVTGSLYSGYKIRFTSIELTDNTYDSSTLTWHYNTSSGSSTSGSYQYGNDYTSCSMDGKNYDRYGYWTASKKTSYTTHQVRISSTGVTATIWYYDAQNTYRTLSLSVGGSLTFDARSGSSYAGATNIRYASGYSTPITWYYNTSQGGTSQTSISNGGENDITTSYDRVISIVATQTPTEYTYYYTAYAYLDGSYYSSVNGQVTVQASGGTSVSLATIRDLFPNLDSSTYSYSGSGSNFDRGYYTVTSMNSSNRTACYIDFTTNTYNYLYRVRPFFDGMHDSEGDHDGYVTTTSSSQGYLALSTAQSYVSVPSRYVFSYASSGNAYAAYESANARFRLTSTSSRGYCDLYYVSRSSTCIAGFVSGSSGMGTIQVSDGYSTGASIEVEYGDSATWTASAYTGYRFVGWYSDQAGNSLVSSSTLYTVSNITSAKTYYAKFQAITVSASASKSGYDCCFQSVSVSNSSPTYGSNVTFTATLNVGYEFVGWFTSTSATTAVSTSTSYTRQITGNTTLYARARVVWTYVKETGSSQISAEEWTRLQTFVVQRNPNATFVLSATSSDPPASNQRHWMTADLYNEMVTAIGTGSSKIRGMAIDHADLNALITNANNL